MVFLSSDDANSWEKFHVAISKEELYRENDSNIDDLLQDMSGLEFYNISKFPFFIVNWFFPSFKKKTVSRTDYFVNHLGQKEGGTQLKLVIEFAQGGIAMLKPMR